MALKRIWMLVHEPRVINTVTSGGWLLFLGIGLAALFAPPATIAHELGDDLTIIWACFLLTGGVLGLVGCPSAWWWVERLGIIAAGTGSLIYFVVVVSLHYAQPGSRLTQAGYILLGLVMLSIRWLRIDGAQVDPMRGAKRVPHN